MDRYVIVLIKQIHGDFAGYLTPRSLGGATRGARGSDLQNSRLARPVFATCSWRIPNLPSFPSTRPGRMVAILFSDFQTRHQIETGVFKGERVSPTR
jgi:hypothetical protein